MSESEPTYDLPGQDADLVYTFSAAPGWKPGESGLVFSARSSGLYRSQDGGQTWQYALDNLELTEALPVTSIALSPLFAQDGIVLAGAPGGIFHSSDSGQTWRALIFPNPPPTVSSLAFSPNFYQDEMVFAGTVEDGVFISLNGGERWVGWNFGLLDLNVMCLAISPAFASDETVFAGTETGIFRSTNGGRAWREIELPFGFEAVLSLGISPNFASDGTLYAGTEGQGLWVTRDAGDTWQHLAEEEIVDPVNSIQVTGSAVYAFTSTAFWHSSDAGATWTNCTPADAVELEVSTVLASTGEAEMVLAALMDGSITVIPLA